MNNKIVVATRKKHGLTIEILDVATAKDLRLVSREINARIKEMKRTEAEEGRSE